MKKIDNHVVFPYLKDAFRQLNEMASVKAKTSELLKHSLEKGLNNEAILREILRTVLPKKFGVGKGQVISSEDIMSRQCDIIIYDAMNCPCLFIDDNMNQILPIEGIYAVAEVKTRLTKHELEDAFEVVYSVKKLVEFPKDLSTNKLVENIPPLGFVICYDDVRTLKTIYENYVSLNRQHHPSYSSLSYSKISPGYSHHTHERFLVEEVVILNKGSVYYMYDGFPVMCPTGPDSLGAFMSGLITNLGEIKLEAPDLLRYYSVVSEYEAFAKSGNTFLKINQARRKRFPGLFDERGRSR